MPSSKNEFRGPSYVEETILDVATREVIGKIRLKPSTILWKPKNSKKFYSVSLEKFCEWIINKETKARKTTS